MTLREEEERVQKAVSRSLSHLQEDPWLAQRVLAHAKGEEPVKRKVSLALVLVIVLGIAMMGTGYALFSSQVAAFFGKHWNGNLGVWLEDGRIAQIGETVSLDGVEFTLDEVVYKNRSIYGVGTARAQNGKDVLLPMDLAHGWELEEGSQSEEGKALAKQAREAGGRLLSVDCWPVRIGVDNGSMMNTGDSGAYNVRNEDGSVTFSFEASGYALEDGTTYQLELSIDLDEWTEEGRAQTDGVKSKTWTVAFEPVMIAETPTAETVKAVSKEEMQLTGFEIVVPEAYRENGTLPIYRAEEYDFTKNVKPEWFNRSGIAEKRSENDFVFQDHAELNVSPEGVWYGEYTGELFDYNARERAADNPDLEAALFPKQALSMGIVYVANNAYSGHEGFAVDAAPEQKQLTNISLADAEKEAEALFDKLGLKGYELAWALDMSLDRIRTLGEAYNQLMFESDEGYSNGPRQDYASATAEDEGYYLVYTPLGVTHVTDGRQQIDLYVTGRGIVNASIRCAYNRGDVLSTPETLIAPEDAVARLYEAAPRARYAHQVGSIERVALTYVAVRAENKQDGTVFSPVWQVRYKEADGKYTELAEFNAVTGDIINASFQ